MSDLLRSFDPAEEQGRTQAEGKIRSAYRKLKARNEEEKAAELREADPVEEQKKLANRFVNDFDPKFDRAYNSARVSIMQAYNALKEAGREEEAEELRLMSSIHPQKEKAIEINREMQDEEPGPYNRGSV